MTNNEIHVRDNTIQHLQKQNTMLVEALLDIKNGKDNPCFIVNQVLAKQHIENVLRDRLLEQQ